jgi:hypothetical protein
MKRARKKPGEKERWEKVRRKAREKARQTFGLKGNRKKKEREKKGKRARESMREIMGKSKKKEEGNQHFREQLIYLKKLNSDKK